jgi:hypothetical protein
MALHPVGSTGNDSFYSEQKNKYKKKASLASHKRETILMLFD